MPEQAAPDWINVLEEMPRADVPMRVRDNKWTFSTACYCAEANDWYVHRPAHPTHGRLYADVFGPGREIVEWMVAPPLRLEPSPAPWTHEGSVVFGLNMDGTGIALDNPADAPLICAAHDMLEALQAVRALAHPLATHIHKVCDDAIAKATANPLLA